MEIALGDTICNIEMNGGKVMSYEVKHFPDRDRIQRDEFVVTIKFDYVKEYLTNTKVAKHD